MRRAATAFLAGLLIYAAAAIPRADDAALLKAGLLLYAAPGLPDPNFENTVILLLEHGATGSLGLVVNRPTRTDLESALDLKKGTLGLDVPVFWGGPVEPRAVMALVRSARPGPRARTVMADVQLTPDLDDIRAALAQRDAPLRVRVFTGYAGWSPGQLAAEVRRRSWVLDRGDAARVFSPEPTQLWKTVHEILARVRA